MKRIWTPLVIAAGYALSLVVYRRLPDLVTPDFSELLPFIHASDARPMSRVGVAFAMPTIGFAMWLTFLLVPSRLGERTARRIFPAWVFPTPPSPEATERQRVYANAIAFTVASFILAFHAAGIATALGAPPSVYHVVPFVFGVALIVAGNLTPRLRPNWFAGVRSPRTLADPQVWARVHRLAGQLLVVAGGLTVVMTFVAGRYAFSVAIAGMLLSLLATVFVGTTSRTSLPSAPGAKP